MTHSESQNTTPIRIVLAGLDEQALLNRANPAFYRTGVFDVETVVTTPEALREVVEGGYVDLAVVEGNVAIRPERASKRLRPMRSAK